VLESTGASCTHQHFEELPREAHTLPIVDHSEREFAILTPRSGAITRAADDVCFGPSPSRRPVVTAIFRGVYCAFQHRRASART
jgi:hypothetical protein